MPYSKCQLKMDQRLEYRHKGIKALEENIGGKLFNISLSDNFLDLTPKQRQKKEQKNPYEIKSE